MHRKYRYKKFSGSLPSISEEGTEYSLILDVGKTNALLDVDLCLNNNTWCSRTAFFKITGALLLVYIAWVLATSFHVTHFLTGTLTFTYSVLGLGMLLFLTGLIGWVASTSEKICTLKLYLTVLIITACSQIGGIVVLNVFGTEMDVILRNGWYEVNQVTRSLVEVKMECCGFEGAHEFSDQATIIADSCYFPSSGSYNVTDKYLKPDGCGAFLKEWFDRNKIIWCSILAILGGLQLMCIVLCAHIIHKLKDKSCLSSPSSSTKNLSSSQFI